MEPYGPLLTSLQGILVAGFYGPVCFHSFSWYAAEANTGKSTFQK
jgi:hypothetical protein